jgi:polyphosphate kinase 2 (PPK2 family)
LRALQSVLYADNRYAVLLILQAMDAAGKDGVIKHVMSGVNPQGCKVFSYKHPSATELQHDFLWRTTRDLPERGQIGIFNRSYYEEVLILRVHPEILRAPVRRARGRPSGRAVTARSTILRAIFIATTRASSSFSAPFKGGAAKALPRTY